MNFVLEKWREYQPPFPQKLRQLGDVHRDPSRLVLAEQIGLFPRRYWRAVATDY